MLEPKGRRSVAVIDLGSNTARLVVMEMVPGYCYRVTHEIREVVRLREGMTTEGLSAAGAERASECLAFFRRYCQSTGAGTVVATATSAVREAANGPAFASRVESELGIALRILEGESEAYYGVLGALNELPLAAGTVLDVGGGSAQLSQVAERRFAGGIALPIGSLALAEMFIRSDPASPAEVRAVRNEIERRLDRVPWLGPAAAPLVGLGGTVRNLARIQAAAEGYPLPGLHGFTLTRASLTRSIAAFRKLPLAQRKKMPGLSSDRGDIILAGALVVQAVMDRLGVDGLAVSASGLREGLFYEHFWSGLSYPVVRDVRGFAVLNRARLYGYEARHAGHVRRLARSLFDQLATWHGYGQPERELLDAAALLHDLGTAVDYRAHPQYSQWLTLAGGLPGFTPRETALVGLIMRYHHKGQPDPADFRSLLRDSDEILLRRLAAFLRLAESLDRSHSGLVRAVAARLGSDRLALQLIADQPPTVEIWEAERSAIPLLETVLGRKVTLLVAGAGG